jgi:phage head maturation protease
VSNANNVRFKNGILSKLAKSFVGVPLLADHDRRLASRAGTVTAAKANKTEDGVEFQMSAKVTAPWAIESLLTGNLDRFSIGWDFPGVDTLECSECGKPVLENCSHSPGELSEKKTGQRIDYVFTEAWGVEVSAVSVPAVSGTRIDDLRHSLSALAARVAAAKETRHNARGEQMNKVKEFFGLGLDASEDSVLTAIDKERATLLAAKQALCAATERATALEAEKLSLQAINSELVAKQKASQLDALVSEYANRLPLERNEAGDRVISKLETTVRELGAKDFDAAKSILESLPVAGPSLHAVQSVKAERGASSDSAYTQEQLEVFAKMGLSLDKVKKFGGVK